MIDSATATRILGVARFFDTTTFKTNSRVGTLYGNVFVSLSCFIIDMFLVQFDEKLVILSCILSAFGCKLHVDNHSLLQNIIMDGQFDFCNSI